MNTLEFKDHKDSKFKVLLDQTKTEDRLKMHSFHRYYGKLIPAIPRAGIRAFTEKGDTIFDPFSGSGTVALESKYLGRNFLGIEINPLSVLIAKVKTANYDETVLNKLQLELKKLVDLDCDTVLESEKPFCVNREHWFKDFVQDDLVRIDRNIPRAVENVQASDPQKYEDFLRAVLSAIVKQVSNADTMHVFPGRSKRMRRLEEEGKIHINVIDSYFRGLKKRIGYISEILGCDESNISILEGDSSSFDLKEYVDSVDLVVTNPPYISSVRYAETLKLELYWMGITKTSKDYSTLSESMIGNDKIRKKDHQQMMLTPYDFVNEFIIDMYQIDTKQAKVLYDYFSLMEKVIKNTATVLKSKKKLIMKISDSKIRKTKIPTGRLLTQIAEQNGFKLVDVFNDKINQNSRSLLTARNTYSDIILEDNIIIWEKL